MRIEKIVESSFERYATQMYLSKNGKEIAFKGFLQPLRYKNKMYLSNVSTELSYNNTRKFLLISPVEIDIQNADGYESLIRTDMLNLCIDHSELVYFKNEPLYCWSIVHVMEKGESDAD